MAIVVSTTTSVPRIIGTVTFENSFQPEAPSSMAASVTSIGIALIAAERTTIAKPTWIQIMMTMSRKLLRAARAASSPGSMPSQAHDLAESSPTCSSEGRGTRRRGPR
jgi:hypothetical protein